MSLKLNSVTDDVVRQNIEYQEGRLSKLLNEPPNSRVRANPVRYHNSLGTICFNLGTDYYQQEHPAGTVVEKLSQAAQYLVEAIALRTPSPTESWQPNVYEKALALAYCFGSKQNRERALTIEGDKIFSEPNPDTRKLYTASFGYVQLLQKYMGSGNFDVDLSERVSGLCMAPNAWKYDQLETANKVAALRAISAGDQTAWNGALAVVVEEHTNQALYGDLQRLNDANMDFPSLLLAKFGQVTAGFFCTIVSPYLPLKLIQ